MTNFGLYTFLHINTICLLMALIYATGSSIENGSDIIKSQYGDGYGTEWIYFPDGYGVLHYVNLSKPKENTLYAAAVGLSSTPVNGVEFRLYMNDMTYILLDNQGHAINDSQQNIVTETLQSNFPLKLITHGWRSSADIENILNITEAYIEAKNVNIITVDWSAIASNVIYHRAAGKTQDVGTQLASFLDCLNEDYNVTGEQLHLIGHSLGAHVMGMAASNTKSKVHRVTGLDPARPFFEIPPENASERLDSTDAEIVDVIHTCAGLLGFLGSIGTVDFFPNKGFAPQPGCDHMLQWLDACSHSISFHYFLQSIKDPLTYPAYGCASWEDFLDQRCNHTGYMGDSDIENMSGIYYLTTTNEKDPFHYVTPDKDTD